jgi:hypothetical protein
MGDLLLGGLDFVGVAHAIHKIESGYEEVDKKIEAGDSDGKEENAGGKIT